MVASNQTTASNRLLQIETVGTEFIPDKDRDAAPSTLFSVFTGANFGWPTVIFGWLPITLGLDFWSALTSTILGTMLAVLLVVPIAVLAQKTGTTTPVASAVFFGLRGRLIGSGLALIASLAYSAIAVWTCGDAIVGSINRMLDLPTNNFTLACGYAIVAIAFTTVAVFGFSLITTVQRLIVPIVGIVFILGVFAFWDRFDAYRTTTELALGSYWTTWFLSLVIGFSGPISYAAYIGDYARRISLDRHGRFKTMASLSWGLILGLLVPITFGMFTAVAIANPSESYVADIVREAPAWYVLPILVVALLGGVGQGVLCIYGTGLDLNSFFPRLSRVQTTVVTALVSIGLVYFGVFVVNASAALSTASLLLNAMTVPWVAILLIGIVRQWALPYNTDDIQDFVHNRQGGAYWFTRGWNIPAAFAWFCGAIFGVLTVEADLYSGILSGILGGIDASVIGSFSVAAILYLIAIALIQKRSG
jgi:purine-cytosine permease-like protein